MIRDIFHFLFFSPVRTHKKKIFKFPPERVSRETLYIHTYIHTYSEDTDLSGVYQTTKDFFADEEDALVVMSTYGYIANL